MRQFDSVGTTEDPKIGFRIGGTITFGGGLALYSGKTIVGGLGLSGDTACATIRRPGKTRINLSLPASPNGAGNPGTHAPASR